jgi:hypothetical protein
MYPNKSLTNDIVASSSLASGFISIFLFFTSTFDSFTFLTFSYHTHASADSLLIMCNFPSFWGGVLLASR